MLHSKDLSFNSGWSFSASLVKQSSQTLCICKYLEFCSTNKKFTKFLYCSPFNCPGFKLCLPPPWLNICQSPACKISCCASIALIPPLSPILCAFLSSFYKDSCFSTFFKIRQHCFFCQRLFDSTKCLLVLIFLFETAFFIHEVIQNCWHFRESFSESLISSNHTKKWPESFFWFWGFCFFQSFYFVWAWFQTILSEDIYKKFYTFLCQVTFLWW